MSSEIEIRDKFEQWWDRVHPFQEEGYIQTQRSGRGYFNKLENTAWESFKYSYKQSERDFVDSMGGRIIYTNFIDGGKPIFVFPGEHKNVHPD